MIHEITIQEYIAQSETLPLIDVRSPGEYQKGHILDSINIPLFTNDERAHVGTTYVQESKEKAIEIGYEYVKPKLQSFITDSKNIAVNNQVAVHCWRGGMRSRSFAELLDENGLKVFLIKGGYKTFRNHVVDLFQKPLDLQIVGGYTGSGKTKILDHLKKHGHQVVDLEGLAHHKGSAFGASINEAQPETEQFENDIFRQMNAFDLSKPIWIEDESANIGNVNIPQDLFKRMRESTVYFFRIPQVDRAKFLVGDYKPVNNESLTRAINRISKRLGGLKTKESLDFIQTGDYYHLALNCLAYYDKYYQKGLAKRDQTKIQIIESDVVEEQINAQKLIETWKKLN